MLRTLLLLSLICLPTLGQGVETSIPFRFAEGLLWVEVTVPQSQSSLQFLVDTGAEVSVIDLSLARRLGLRPGRTASARGVGVNLSGEWQDVTGATVAGEKLPKSLLGLDLKEFSSSCATPVAGLLGIDFFSRRPIEIDFIHERIRILQNEPTPTGFKEVRLQTRSCGMRVLFRVNGQREQWIRLDTGCATSLQWVNSKVQESSGQKIAVGFAKLSIPQTETSVSLGGYRFEAVPTGLHRTPIFPGEAGLLGNGLLSRFAWVRIDPQAGRLFLGPLRREN